MSDYEVKCSRCHCEVEHVCNPDLRESVKKLFNFVPESGFPEKLKKGNEHLSSEDREENERGVEAIDRMQFFTETYLYALIGKEDARTVLAYVNSVIRAAGLDPRALQLEVWKENDAKEKAEIERLAKVAENKRLREEARQPTHIADLPDGKRWDYEEPRGWDEAIAFNCDEKSHAVLGIENPKDILAHCTDCNVYYRLAKDKFRSHFVETERTPLSSVAIKLARAMGANLPSWAGKSSSTTRKRRR